MSDILREGDFCWIEGTFKTINFINADNVQLQRVKVKVDRAFRIDAICPSCNGQAEPKTYLAHGPSHN